MKLRIAFPPETVYNILWQENTVTIGDAKYNRKGTFMKMEKKEIREECNIGRKLRGLCAWLCAFLMAFTVLAGAVPVEVLAAKYGLDYEITDGTIMQPGDEVVLGGIWSHGGIGSYKYFGVDKTPIAESGGIVGFHTVLDFMGDVPEGMKFAGWKVKGGQVVDSGGSMLQCRNIEFYAVFEPVDDPDTDSPGETQIFAAQGSESQGESAEQIFLRKWAAWIVNPDSYLPAITLPDGSEERSAVPVVSESGSGFGFIVSGTTEEAERAFGKTSPENQIVVTFADAYPGEQMKETLEAFAEAGGASLKAVFEIEAVERGKADYALIRQIPATAEEVTYRFSLDQSIRDSFASGRSLMAIQYVPQLKSFLTLDTSDLRGGILTVRTQYPTGTFAFYIF